MLDESSLTVTYNDWRGEPRSRHAKKALAAGQLVGDCVDCNTCVAVCPMGIDIRDGQQLECITCALCIDACDGVMEKLGKETGLISYTTLLDYNANMAVATGDDRHAIDPALVRRPDGRFSDRIAHFHLKDILRPRTFIYLGVWSALGLAMLYGLLTRERLEINVLHDRNPQYVLLSDGSIRNGYTVKLLNMVPEKRLFELSLDGLPGATMSVVGFERQGNHEHEHEKHLRDRPGKGGHSDSEDQSGTGGRSLTIPVEPDKLQTLKVYVKLPAADIQEESSSFRLHVRDTGSGEAADYVATFNAPEKH